MTKITPPSLDKLLLWLTEAATVFLNGCLAGIGGGAAAGAGTGGAAAASTGAITPGSLSAALLAAGCAALGNGIKRFMVWHDANPLPNPFVAEQQSSAP